VGRRFGLGAPLAGLRFGLGTLLALRLGGLLRRGRLRLPATRNSGQCND
jgi:hypothetical protein